MQHINKSAADVAARAAFFQAVADDLVQTILPPTEVLFIPSRLPPMTDAYFLLNDGYKRWRIVAGHRTKPSKIAALTSMAIMTFQPFRPLPTSSTLSLTQIKSNEIYALACSLAILQNPLGFHGDFNRNLVLRIFDIMENAGARQTLQSFLVDLNMQIIQNTYTLNIHDNDKLVLNSLITIFELLEKQFKIAKKLAVL